MSEVITTKSRMYELLSAGKFGNTIPQYFSVKELRASGDDKRHAVWGVRTLTPGGPCRLYCPVDEIAATAKEFESLGHKINISCMIDAVCTVTMWMELFDSEIGLVVYGVEYPGVGASWRKTMPTHGKQYHGLQASMMLRKHLNENSLDDLEILRERYPGHVIELSATEECFGCVPFRNGCLWEVRAY